MLENDATAAATGDSNSVETGADRVIGSRTRIVLRGVRQHATHPLTHISGLIGAHLVALTVMEKTPLLIILGLH